MYVLEFLKGVRHVVFVANCLEYLTALRPYMNEPTPILKFKVGESYEQT